MNLLHNPINENSQGRMSYGHSVEGGKRGVLFRNRAPVMAMALNSARNLTLFALNKSREFKK